MVAILDNDPGIGFERGQYTNAWGNPGEIALTVLRGNDLALGPITVDYATSDLTARAGVDYQGGSGIVQFQENETVKNLIIPILQGRPAGAARTFRVTLSNPTGGATLGTPSTTVYLVGAFVPVAPPFDTTLSIQSVGRLNTLTWAGGGVLQRADSPLGPWQSLAAARSPTTVRSLIPTTFYRVTRPRPVNLYVPSSYDGQTSMPLVILLHGYGVNGAEMESNTQFQPLAESRGFLYCYPDSAFDRWGGQPWNATDACCDFEGTGIDDASYLQALVEDTGRRFAVDPKRVYLIGGSNGGFMAYRMACQFADVLAGIVCIAGGTFLNPSRCQPAQPVNVLHIHGTDDVGVFYGGGALVNRGPYTFAGNLPAHPGALQTVQIWAGYNGASAPVTDAAPSLDLTTDVAGLDTVVTRYTSFPQGGAVELWTIIGGSHVPTLSPQFSPRVIDWLLAHPKP
jgi:polyhydroxybutyrate depolymerase